MKEINLNPISGTDAEESVLATGETEEENYRKPHSISESITIFLREAILKGTLRPGQRINEQEIAARLHVSRSPLREALRTIAKEELVKITPRRGAIVAEFSLRELQEIFQVREMMELFAIDLIERQGITDFEEMRACLDFDPESVSHLDIGAYLHQFTRFHLALVKTTANAKLCELYQVLSNSLVRYQRIVASFPARMALSIGEHQLVLDALTRGSFKEAKELLQHHLRAIELKILSESNLLKPGPPA